MIILAVLAPSPSFAFQPVFEIRTKHGTVADGTLTQKFADATDPENSLRIGIELKHGIWLGYDSAHGLAMVYEF